MYQEELLCQGYISSKEAHLDVDGPIEIEGHVIEQALMLLEAYDWVHAVQTHV